MVLKYCLKKRLIIFAALFVFTSTIRAEIYVLPNFNCLETRSQDDISSIFSEQVSNSIDVDLPRPQISNECNLRPFQIHISYSNNNLYLPIQCLKVMLITNTNRSLIQLTDSSGKVTFGHLWPNDFPLTVRIPVINNYRRNIPSPIRQLSLETTLSKLDNCINRDERLYIALFQHLLLETRTYPLFLRVDFVVRYYRDYLATESCSSISTYLVGIRDNSDLRRQLIQSCLGINNCLPD